MKLVYCVKCQKEHTSADGWSHRKWQVDGELVEGWGCAKVRLPEFVPERIKDERRKYYKDTLQPHREGYASKEFIQAYPEQARKMFSKKEIRRAKNVWQ